MGDPRDRNEPESLENGQRGRRASGRFERKRIVDGEGGEGAGNERKGRRVPIGGKKKKKKWPGRPRRVFPRLQRFLVQRDATGSTAGGLGRHW